MDRSIRHLMSTRHGSTPSPGHARRPNQHVLAASKSLLTLLRRCTDARLPVGDDALQHILQAASIALSLRAHRHELTLEDVSDVDDVSPHVSHVAADL